MLSGVDGVYGQFYVRSTDGNLDIYIDNSVCVDSGGTMFVDGNFYCQDIGFNSDGQVTLYSSELADVLLPSKFSGSGTLVFEGTGDFDVASSDDFWVSNLTVNTGGAVSLSDNFSVNRQLDLSGGLVNVASPNVLMVESDDESAVLFDDNDYDLSYVVGCLGRNVKTTGTYYFPIGGSTGAYPVYVAGAESADAVIAQYDKTIGSDAELVVSDGTSMLSESGWHVYGENQNNYKIGLWAPEQFEASYKAGIIKSESSGFSDYSEIWDTENDYQSYLSTTGSVTGEYYALIEREEDSDDEIKLRNFFTPDNGNSTVFEIPDASDYTNIKLSLYNKLGTRLFYAESYTNQLDLINYPTGTYYYELILIKGSNVKKIYNFIEVKNEDY